MTANARVESTVGTSRLWKSTSAGTLGYSHAGTTQASHAMVSRLTEKSKTVDPAAVEELDVPTVTSQSAKTTQKSGFVDRQSQPRVATQCLICKQRKTDV